MSSLWHDNCGGLLCADSLPFRSKKDLFCNQAALFGYSDILNRSVVGRCISGSVTICYARCKFFLMVMRCSM
jgi:hypothetical protein